MHEKKQKNIYIQRKSSRAPMQRHTLRPEWDSQNIGGTPYAAVVLLPLYENPPNLLAAIKLSV